MISCKFFSNQIIYGVVQNKNTWRSIDYPLNHELFLFKYFLHFEFRIIRLESKVAVNLPS